MRLAYLTRSTASRATEDESASLYSSTGLATVLRTYFQQATNKLLVAEQVNQRLYINRWTKSLDLGAAWLGIKGLLHCQGRFRFSTIGQLLWRILSKRDAPCEQGTHRDEAEGFSPQTPREGAQRTSLASHASARHRILRCPSLVREAPDGPWEASQFVVPTVSKWFTLSRYQNRHRTCFWSPSFPTTEPQIWRFRICVDCDGCHTRSETHRMSAAPNVIGGVLQSAETADVSSFRAVLFIAFTTSWNLDGLN